MFSGHRAKCEVVEMISMELGQAGPVCFEQSKCLKWRTEVTLKKPQSVLRERWVMADKEGLSYSPRREGVTGFERKIGMVPSPHRSYWSTSPSILPRH